MRSIDKTGGSKKSKPSKINFTRRFIQSTCSVQKISQLDHMIKYRLQLV